MENKNTMIAIVLIVGLVVGAGLGYTLAPKETAPGEIQTITVEKQPLAGETVQIGVVSSMTSGLEIDNGLYNEIIGADINDYASKLGYDVEFEFLVDDAAGQAAIHLEKVQSFKSMDLELMVAGYWSSMAQAALNYVNENDMIMVSPMSTSPTLEIPDDNLFRTVPSSIVQKAALINMLDSLGIENVIVFQRADSLTDAIWDMFSDPFEANGGTIIERVRYAAESTEFSNYLQIMDVKIGEAIEEYGAENVGIIALTFDEIVTIVTQTPDYPNLREVLWVGIETTGRNQRMLDDAGGRQTDLRLFSAFMAPTTNAIFDKLDERFFAKYAQPTDFYTATKYDSAHLLAYSVLESGSVKCEDNLPHIMDVAKRTYGASGWLVLNEAGDRKPGPFDIWGYAEIDGEHTFARYGGYNGYTGEVTWDMELMNDQGVVLPE